VVVHDGQNVSSGIRTTVLIPRDPERSETVFKYSGILPCLGASECLVYRLTKQCDTGCSSVCPKIRTRKLLKQPEDRTVVGNEHCMLKNPSRDRLSICALVDIPNSAESRVLVIA
jgi:hypothetical protein